jgi:hypothetical protein
MLAHCFESDPCELLTRVHDRHPVWTRLELAKGAQDNFRMRRNTDAKHSPSRIGKNWADRLRVPVVSSMRMQERTFSLWWPG